MNIPKGVGIALGILVIITIILIFNNNEGFTVVEEDVDKMINGNTVIAGYKWFKNIFN